MQDQLQEEFIFWQNGKLKLQAKRVFHLSHRASPVLVFLHDALGSIEQWQSFPYRASQALGMDALVYERTGHGASSPLMEPRSAQYLHQEALEVLPQLLKELKIEKPILIGHSDGGSIALIYAAHHKPSLIVTMAAHILVEEITLRGIREANTQRSFLEGKLKKYHGDKTSALFQAWADTWLSQAFMNWDIQEEIQNITCPILAIQGELDQYGSALQIEGIQKALLPGKVTPFWIKNGKHMPHLEVPEIVITKIQEFVQTHIN